MRDRERNCTPFYSGSIYTDLRPLSKTQLLASTNLDTLTMDIKPYNRLLGSITLPNRLDGSVRLTIDFTGLSRHQ